MTRITTGGLRSTPEAILDFKSEHLCKNCGQCCYLVIEGKKTSIPCPYLIKEDDGTTRCLTYRRRLGRFIKAEGHTFMCIPRAISKYNYSGCGYNKPGKPLL